MLADGRLLGGVDRDWMDGSFCVCTVQEGDGCRTGALYRVRRCGALWSEWMLCCNLTVAPPQKTGLFQVLSTGPYGVLRTPRQKDKAARGRRSADENLKDLGRRGAEVIAAGCPIM
jgi:hypothetical protein